MLTTYFFYDKIYEACYKVAGNLFNAQTRGYGNVMCWVMYITSQVIDGMVLITLQSGVGFFKRPLTDKYCFFEFSNNNFVTHNVHALALL